MKDYYGRLGVQPDIAQKDLAKAYRRAAQLCYPDAGGSHDAFLKLSEAYGVLKDPDGRQAYDAGLSALAAESIARAKVQERRKELRPHVGRDLFASGDWAVFVSSKYGGQVFRTKVDHVPDSYADAMVAFMKQSGLDSADIIQSDTFGNRNVQILSRDFLKFEELINTLHRPALSGEVMLKDLKWNIFHSPKHGNNIERADVTDFLPQDRSNLVRYLNDNGVSSATIVFSDTFNRLSVQVQPKDKAALETLIKKQKSPMRHFSKFFSRPHAQTHTP